MKDSCMCRRRFEGVGGIRRRKRGAAGMAPSSSPAGQAFSSLGPLTACVRGEANAE
jgi:hypothetical protein